jgi:hypothetical protein
VSAKTDQLDRILEQTIPRPRRLPRPKMSLRKPFFMSIRDWSVSQVSAYRVGLVAGYVAMIYFGASALVAGIPVFSITTPDPLMWTRGWAIAVILGGLVAGIGAIRAGAEPATREVKIFNGIELAGSITLFIALGSYSAMLLILGYGYGDATRASIGAGFFALGIHPAVRMLWLILRPRFLSMRARHTSPIAIFIPEGHALFSVNRRGEPIKAVAISTGSGGE